jgi:hypothetical protein
MQGPSVVKGHKRRDKMIQGLQIQVEDYSISDMTFLKV